MRSWKRLGFPKQVSRFKRFTGLPGFTWVCLGLPGFAPVPGLAFLGRIRITLHLSPTCLPLVLHLSHSWCSGPHDSTLVSDLCPIRCCELLDATLVSHCLPVPNCLQPVCNLALDGKNPLLPLSSHFLCLPVVSLLSSACVPGLFLEWKNFTCLLVVSHFSHFTTSVFALRLPWSPVLFFSTYGLLAGKSSALDISPIAIAWGC